MKDKIKCPFCGGEVHIVVCDDDANIHREKGYEEDPCNGLGYVLIHKQEDVPNNIYCPIATYADEDFIGGLIYDTREEAVKIWENNEIARLTEENERLRAEKTCRNISDKNPVDEFKCSKCGFMTEDFHRLVIDEDDGEHINYEYIIKYCPNCGAKVKDEQ